MYYLHVSLKGLNLINHGYNPWNYETRLRQTLKGFNLASYLYSNPSGIGFITLKHLYKKTQTIKFEFLRFTKIRKI